MTMAQVDEMRSGQLVVQLENDRGSSLKSISGHGIVMAYGTV
jgi:hypothetical protein